MEQSIRELDICVAASSFKITEVVSGAAKGIDTAGEIWCASKGLPLTRFPADWRKHGRAAGPIRNRQMAEYADALILIWDGKSRGSANMLKTARDMGLLVHQKIVFNEPNTKAQQEG